MRNAVLVASAIMASVIAGTASAQSLENVPPLDLGAAIGEPGEGWRKQSATDEGLTFVCESEACGGRGVLGVGQAKTSPDYVKAVIADPDKMLKSYQYGSEESMKPSGCSFSSYATKRIGEQRVQYTSVGTCPQGGHAAMTTIFDGNRPYMISVQVLTGSEAAAVKLRDQTTDKLNSAL
ncbi:hypothetical protein ACIKT0_12835 [Hansschlegelia beijingensis]|uniref:hypothetical protein n=1 Tax=Hansschlegelia beijingensis TaxID=1133344 RepID=UPI00387F139F